MTIICCSSKIKTMIEKIIGILLLIYEVKEKR